MNLVDESTLQLSDAPGAAPLRDLDSAQSSGVYHQLIPVLDPDTAVDATNSVITLPFEHSYATGDSLVYEPNGGMPIEGLVPNQTYYAVVVGESAIALADSIDNANKSRFRSFDPTTNISPDGILELGVFHGFQAGDPVTYISGDTSDLGLTDGETYYVIVVDETSIQLALGPDGATNLPTVAEPFDLTNAVSEFHTIRGNHILPVSSATATGDAHRFRTQLRKDLGNDAPTPTTHSLRLSYLTDKSSGTKHGIGRHFDSSSIVSQSSNPIDLNYVHGFQTGQELLYSSGNGIPIGGLNPGDTYYAIASSPSQLQVARTLTGALNGEPIALDTTETSGSQHSFSAVLPAVPAVDSSTNTINLAKSHGFNTGDPVIYSSGTGTNIGGLNNNATYFVVTGNDSNAFQLAATKTDALQTPPEVLPLDVTGVTGTDHAFLDPTDSQGFLTSEGNSLIDTTSFGAHLRHYRRWHRNYQTQFQLQRQSGFKDFRQHPDGSACRIPNPRTKRRSQRPQEAWLGYLRRSQSQLDFR